MSTHAHIETPSEDSQNILRGVNKLAAEPTKAEPHITPPSGSMKVRAEVPAASSQDTASSDPAAPAAPHITPPSEAPYSPLLIK
jgi:hypothetical protein